MLVNAGLRRTQNSLSAKVSAILRKYGTDAHVYLPGIGVINGLTAGNYLDSAGTTAATVDNPVGGVLDATGTLGTDKAGVLDGTWTRAAAVSNVGSTMVASGLAAGANGFYKNIGVSGANKAYRIEITVSAYTSGNITAWVGGQQVDIQNARLSSSGTLVFSVIASVSSNGVLIVGSSGAIGNFTISSVNVREIVGIHATQATGANQPYLRRGDKVNLWQYTEDLATNRYSTTNATKQVDTITHEGITLTRLSMANFYSSLRSAIGGLGLTPFTIGDRYLVSCYVKSAAEQFMWMRSLVNGSSFGHGAKLLDTTPRRIWMVAQADTTSTLSVVTTPTTALGSEAGAECYWIAQNNTEGGAGEVYIGGFQIEKISNTYIDGVALIGDSTMAGASGGYDASATNAREVSVWMGAGLNVNVFNRAIGGNKLSDMDARWATDITPLAVNCKYVVIQGGINDIGNGVSLAACQASINSMVSKATTDGLLPVIFTCTPAAAIAANPAYEAIRVALNAWIISTFPRTVDIAAALADPANTSVLNPSWVGDGTHYAAAGKKVAGQLAANQSFWVLTAPRQYQKVVATSYTSYSSGNYHWVHDSTDLLTLTLPVGYESATTIDISSSGQSTLTAQNITGTYSIGTSIDTYGRFIFRTGLTASELAIIQAFANIFVGL